MSQRSSEVWWPIQSARPVSRKCPFAPLASVYSQGAIFTYALKYQLALHKIESVRKDGRFHGADGSVPEGQGIVMAHLNECHELIELVRSIMQLLGLGLGELNPIQLKEAMMENENDDDLDYAYELEDDEIDEDPDELTRRRM